MHNGQTADPLNEFSKAMKEISSKRKKVDADHEKLAELEWRAALYVDDQKRPVIPARVLEAAFVAGAKKSKLGKSASAAVYVDSDAVLEYDGPKDVDAMWEDKRFRLVVPVRVQMARIVRTRPKIDKWSAEVSVSYMTDVLNKSQVETMVRDAGIHVGIGDWRPKYGRFTVEVLE
jgi:hypothetical protein